VLLCGRRIDSARALQRELATCADVPVEVAPDLESAVRAADVVVACTSSNTPVVMNDWVRPGTHVVSVASRRPTTQELDPLLIARSRFVVDSKTAARVELGDYLVPLSQGLIDESHIWAELGELVNGARVGRSSPEQITVYKSAGLAIQDLAAAGLLIGK
jgi:ornithine cyclodeaminase/alanine dehydrogenase-like protein (mu-crystallin family)